MSREIKEMYVRYNMDEVAVISAEYGLTNREQMILGLIYSFKENDQSFKMNNITIAMRLFGKKFAIGDEKTKTCLAKKVSNSITRLKKLEIIKCTYSDRSKNNRTDIFVIIPRDKLDKLLAEHYEFLDQLNDYTDEKAEYQQNQQTELPIAEPTNTHEVCEQVDQVVNDSLYDEAVGVIDVIFEEHIEFEHHKFANNLNTNPSNVVGPITNTQSINGIKDDDLPF